MSFFLYFQNWPKEGHWDGSRVKMLAAESENLTSVPKTLARHSGKRETQSKNLFFDLHTYTVAHKTLYTVTNTVNKWMQQKNLKDKKKLSKASFTV